GGSSAAGQDPARRRPRAGTRATHRGRVTPPAASSVSESWDALERDLTALFAEGVGAPLPDDAFDRWALRVFRWQYAQNAPFRGYCDGHGATPATVERWTQVPPVPTSAFKHVRLLSLGPEGREEALFRTSGTTRGRERRGEHPIASLALYRAALLPPFRAHLLPDGVRPRLLSLAPPPALAPHSSLGHMLGAVVDAVAAEGSAWIAGEDGAPDAVRAREALRAAAAEDAPVLIATTAFALVHLLDALAREGVNLRLPGGS